MARSNLASISNVPLSLYQSDFNQIADILDSDPHDLDLQGTDLHDPDILNTDLHDLDLSSISQYHLYALVSNEI